MARRIGIIPDTFARPLFSRFRSPEFDLSVGTPGELALKLRGDHLDGAFLSPVDAALNSRTLRLVPGGALVSRGGGRTAHLVFREGLHTIGTIAADPGRTAEIVLAHLVLLEKYDTVPRIIPLPPDTTDPLSAADAVLLAGDRARSSPGDNNRIDLIEEWEDVAELPFVHGLWFAREGRLGAADAAPFSAPAGGAERDGALSYAYDDDARAGLSEFLEIAYYHGILKEIPEFRVLDPFGAS